MTAKRTLARLEYANVSTRIGDGFLGWPDAAPFDKIMVTCSPESVPQPLIDQLREGGQMIIPVGERFQQTLFRMTKRDGKLVRQPLRPTLFVPMTGQAEEQRQAAARRGQSRRGQRRLRTRCLHRPESGCRRFCAGLVLRSPGSATGRDHPVRGRPIANPVHTAGDTTPDLSNQTPGLSAHLLQGNRNRRKTGAADSARAAGCGPTASARDPRPMRCRRSRSAFTINSGRELATFTVGPFRGSRPWREASRLIRVPAQARELILRIGLFGATGNGGLRRPGDRAGQLAEKSTHLTCFAQTTQSSCCSKFAETACSQRFCRYPTSLAAD